MAGALIIIALFSICFCNLNFITYSLIILHRHHRYMDFFPHLRAHILVRPQPCPSSAVVAAYDDLSANCMHPCVGGIAAAVSSHGLMIDNFQWVASTQPTFLKSASTTFRQTAKAGGEQWCAPPELSQRVLSHTHTGGPFRNTAFCVGLQASCCLIVDPRNSCDSFSIA